MQFITNTDDDQMKNIELYLLAHEPEIKLISSIAMSPV